MSSMTGLVLLYVCTLVNEECSIALEHNLHIFSVDSSIDISFSNTTSEYALRINIYIEFEVFCE